MSGQQLSLVSKLEPLVGLRGPLSKLSAGCNVCCRMVPLTPCCLHCHLRHTWAVCVTTTPFQGIAPSLHPSGSELALLLPHTRRHAVLADCATAVRSAALHALCRNSVTLSPAAQELERQAAALMPGDGRWCGLKQHRGKTFYLADGRMKETDTFGERGITAVWGWWRLHVICAELMWCWAAGHADARLLGSMLAS